MRSFTRLDRRLRFIPLGLFWGLVAGGFNTFHGLMADDERSVYYHGVELDELIIPMILVMVGTCPTATLLGSALLKPRLSASSWIVNWVTTGVASSLGGVAIFWLAAAFLGVWTGPPPAALSNPLYIIGSLMIETLAILIGFLIFGILIVIESAVVALLLAPLSLLGRWLILRQARVGEPAGGASQTQL